MIFFLYIFGLLQQAYRYIQFFFRIQLTVRHVIRAIISNPCVFFLCVFCLQYIYPSQLYKDWIFIKPALGNPIALVEFITSELLNVLSVSFIS